MTDTSAAQTDPTDEPDEDLEPIPVIGPQEEAPEFDKPQFMVVGDTFIAQVPQADAPEGIGGLVEIRIGLTYKAKTIRATPNTVEPIGALFWLLENDPSPSRKVSNAHALETLDNADYIDALLVGRKFSQAYTERQKARLGESGRSSRS